MTNNYNIIITHKLYTLHKLVHTYIVTYIHTYIINETITINKYTLLMYNYIYTVQ